MGTGRKSNRQSNRQSGRQTLRQKGKHNPHLPQRRDVREDEELTGRQADTILNFLRREMLGKMKSLQTERQTNTILTFLRGEMLGKMKSLQTDRQTDKHNPHLPQRRDVREDEELADKPGQQQDDTIDTHCSPCQLLFHIGVQPPQSFCHCSQ